MCTQLNMSQFCCFHESLTQHHGFCDIAVGSHPRQPPRLLPWWHGAPSTTPLINCPTSAELRRFAACSEMMRHNLHFLHPYSDRAFDQVGQMPAILPPGVSAYDLNLGITAAFSL